MIIIFLVINVSLERCSIRRYNLGIEAAIACFFLMSAVCLEYILRTYSSFSHGLPRHQSIFTAVQVVAALISLVSFLLFPRRPSVSHQGQTVDKQYTVSALNRWTWTWAGEYLATARVNGLALTDLPKLHFHQRAEYLHGCFRSMKQKERLWTTLLAFHYQELIAQSLLSAFQGFVQFGPQLAMYKLLQLLEQSTDDISTSAIAWAWVLGLGGFVVLAAWLEAWTHWIVLARLGLPIRTELSALIFAKSMRRKDVKGVDSVPQTLDAVPELENDEDIQKSRQSIINLLAVDTKRISDFATFHFIFSQTAAKLTASIIFLVKLIGWESLLAGMAISVLITPVNIYASKSYARSQTDLMNARDRKMVVVTEALQGMF